MIKTFSSAKVSLMMVGEGHEKGIARTFSHLSEHAKDEDIQALGEWLQTISPDQFDNAVITTAYRLETE